MREAIVRYGSLVGMILLVIATAGNTLIYGWSTWTLALWVVVAVGLAAAVGTAVLRKPGKAHQ